MIFYLQVIETIFFIPVDENEIHHTVCVLKISYSKGHDDLSTIILKNCANELSQPFCTIFNKSLEDGIVRTGFKIAKIIPIYKADYKKIVSNYRPISVLPVFLKY